MIGAERGNMPHLRPFQQENKNDAHIQGQMLRQLMSYPIPKCFLDLSGMSMCISKRINQVISEVHVSIFFSFFQLQNSFQQPWEVELSLGWFFAIHFQFRTMCMVSNSTDLIEDLFWVFCIIFCTTVRSYAGF